MRTIHDAKQKLTVKEAALLLGRNASNIYRWIGNGSLPHSYDEADGKTLVIDKGDLLKAEAKNLRHGTRYRRHS